MVAGLDTRYEALAKSLQDIAYQLDDIAEEVRRERDNAEYNPDLLEEIDERLDLIFKLKRKYGSSIDEILEYCKKTELQLEETLKSTEIVENLSGRLKETEAELYTIAFELNKSRRHAAALLEDRIGAELSDLEMKRSKFSVDITFDDAAGSNGERRYKEDGLDRVEFLISPNVGEPLKPLSKIASGGEMSRIMLAIKTILADVDEIPTLIFDEIDIGISGKASQKVGEKLSYISRNHQVICVTHLAQIASMADQQFLIEKMSGEDSTRTSVTSLSEERIKGEIARILGGSTTSETSLRYAEEMLRSAADFKSPSQNTH
jgi:DNA repair protein RecN (Recombination protein N)